MNNLPLMAIFGSERCALGLGRVESVMKMMFHSIRENVQLSRGTCAPLSKPPPFYFSTWKMRNEENK